MKKRYFAMAVVAVLVLNAVGFSAHDTHNAVAKKRAAARLVSLVPASDGIAVFDSKRFINEALPQILSSNQSMLGQITAKINEMENRTGIDLRKFEQVAVGVTVKPVSATETDFEPVAIASGDINAGALIAIARLASNGTYREEKLGERTIYVFSAKDMMQKTSVPAANSKIVDYIDKAVNGISKDIAVAAIDRNTLVMGPLPRVRETLEAKTHVSADIIALLPVTESTVASFSFKSPGGMGKLLPLDKDQFGANIDSIQFLTGSVDVAAAGTSVQIMARTQKAEQAKDLKDMLDGLQLVGKAFLGTSKRNDQQVYARMIKNAKIELRGTDVSLALTVPQTDIDILIGVIK